MKLLFRYFEAEEGARYCNMKILVDFSFFCEAACFDAKRLLTSRLKGQLSMRSNKIENLQKHLTSDLGLPLTNCALCLEQKFSRAPLLEPATRFH